MKKDIFEKLKQGDNDYRLLLSQEKTSLVDKEFLSLEDKFSISDSNLYTINDLVFLGYNYDDTYNVPEYQRELKWTKAQKQNLVLSILKGFPIGDFLFKYDDTDTVAVKFWIIDGQQRINAIREFAVGKLKLPDGRTINDIKYGDARAFFEYRSFKAQKIKNISIEDEIQLYLDRNTGGTLHTKRELDKARSFIQKEV